MRTIFQLPEGFGVESVPKGKTIEFQFGKYNCRYDWEATTRQLKVIASLDITQHVVKAANYPQLMEFKKAVDADVNEKIVVKKMSVQ